MSRMQGKIIRSRVVSSYIYVKQNVGYTRLVSQTSKDKNKAKEANKNSTNTEGVRRRNIASIGLH